MFRVTVVRSLVFNIFSFLLRSFGKCFLGQLGLFLLQYFKWPSDEIVHGYIASPVSSSLDKCTVSEGEHQLTNVASNTLAPVVGGGRRLEVFAGLKNKSGKVSRTCNYILRCGRKLECQIYAMKLMQ